MKKLIKKTITLSCLFGVLVMLAGCVGGCPNKHHMRQKPTRAEQRVEYYQTYRNNDVNNIKATMYTHSKNGGESKMGYIKFVDSDNGVKMKVDVKDLRPGVTYTPRIYTCEPCASGAATCCGRSLISVDLPKLRVASHERLEETYTLRGISAAQLQNAQIYLERDGGYKAAWGTFNKGM